MKIGKKPRHWPMAPPEQQIEGLKFIAKQFDMNELEAMLSNLVFNGYMSKSRRWKTLKRLRKIKGISYREWRARRTGWRR